MKPIKISSGESLTLRDTLALKKYLTEVSSTNVLSVKEEIELFTAYNNGNQNARDKIIKANLRFVLSCAKFYINRGVSYEDLVAEGNIGLIKAVNKFDITKGFKFISYAVWWIQQSMLSCIYKNSKTIRLPYTCYSNIIKIDEYKAEFNQKFKRDPTVLEISDKLNMKEREVYSITSSFDKAIELDYVNPVTELSLLDTLAIENEDNSDEINNMKVAIPILMNKCLKQDEKDILNYFYGLNSNEELTMNQISDKLNLDKIQINNKKKMAINKIRSYISRNKNFKKLLI